VSGKKVFRDAELRSWKLIKADGTMRIVEWTAFRSTLSTSLEEKMPIV
jgi:hypothetical protein